MTNKYVIVGPAYSNGLGWKVIDADDKLKAEFTEKTEAIAYLKELQK